MAEPTHPRRPRLALPFTVLSEADTVRLVAGEDYRYTLTGPGLDQWLPGFVARLTGAEPLDRLLEALPEVRREAGLQLVERLYGERVLVDGPAMAAHVARSFHVIVTGQGVLRERLQRPLSSTAGKPRLIVLCQDVLDYAAAIVAQRDARAVGEPFLWVSYGAMTRAYVSPLLLPDAGPCLACLLRAFQRLSPVPEVYDALLEHGRQHKPFTPVGFPEEGLAILQALTAWKLSQAEAEQPAPALYRLHVLQRDTMEMSTERVFVDPECPQCHTLRR